jgi:hypothetical protein
MTTGISTTVANAILNALCKSSAWSEPAEFWVKLHTADPGDDGTTAAASNTTRMEGTFSAASGGAITNSADLAWVSVSQTETYSHVSFWDASTAGAFLGSDALETARGVTAGDNFTISAGDLDLSITPIAAD